jgi:hypothetical protein
MNLTAEPLVAPVFDNRKPKPVNNVSSSAKVKSFGLLNKRFSNFSCFAIPSPIDSVQQKQGMCNCHLVAKNIGHALLRTRSYPGNVLVPKLERIGSQAENQSVPNPRTHIPQPRAVVSIRLARKHALVEHGSVREPQHIRFLRARQ